MPLFHANQFVAHRGYAKHYPENTLTAITAAIRAGAQHIEIDIQFSKDGLPMVYHDDDLLRVSNINQAIQAFTAEQLITLPAYEPARFGEQFIGVPIADAEEFAILAKVRPHIHFYVELKEEAIAQWGAEHCLEQLAILFSEHSNITLISFDLHACLLAKTQYGFQQTGIVCSDWANRNSLIEQYQADVAFFDINDLPADGELNAACPIAVYEVDDVEIAVNLLQRGASQIETFAIGELIEALCKPNTM